MAEQCETSANSTTQIEAYDRSIKYTTDIVYDKPCSDIKMASCVAVMNLLVKQWGYPILCGALFFYRLRENSKF